MADQTTVRPINALGGIAGNLVLPPVLAPIGPGVAAATVLWSGEMVGLDVNGNAVSASAAACITVLGIVRKTADNRTTGTPPTSGLAGAISCEILSGPYSCLSDGSITVATPYGADLFVVDNQTVSTSDLGGARLRAGYFTNFDGFSNPVVTFGVGSPSARSFGGFTTSAFKARAVVVTTAVATYTGTGTGTLTAGSNAALVADGVALAANDVVILPAGVLGSLTITAADAGPYVVTAPGTAGAKFVLTRPDWWAHGSSIGYTPIEVGPEGTLFAGTTWKAFATPSTSIVDTTDPALYPREVSQAVTLASGTVTISNVPIRSTSKTAVELIRTATGGTVSSTVQYCPTSAGANGITAGALGTAAAIVQATVAAGTIANTDTSILNATIINW